MRFDQGSSGYKDWLTKYKKKIQQNRNIILKIKNLLEPQQWMIFIEIL